jgi:predicted phage tail protein
MTVFVLLRGTPGFIAMAGRMGFSVILDGVASMITSNLPRNRFISASDVVLGRDLMLLEGLDRFSADRAGRGC